MATAYHQDRDFRDAMIPENSFLESAIEWIGKNMEPEDVFSKTKLDEWAEEWAENNGYSKGIEG